MVAFGQKLLHSGKVVEFRQSGFIRARWLYSGKKVVFGKKWLYSGKIRSLREKVFVFEKKWLNSSKSSCFRAKVVLFGQ